MSKKLHIAVTIDEEDMTHTSFYFGEATVNQLARINAELDILKLDIINRIDNAPKDYEISDSGEEDEEEEP